MEIYTLEVPACLKLSNNGKNYYLNLNNYRNWHYIVSNNLKKAFSVLVKNELSKIPKLERIEKIEYTLIKTTKRKVDRMNIYSVVDKFFCDALQTHGVIPDDSDFFIKEFSFKQYEYIKGKPNEIRCRVSLYYKIL